MSKKKDPATDPEVPTPGEPPSGVAVVVAALSSLTLEDLDAQIAALQLERDAAKIVCQDTIAAAIAKVREPAEAARDVVVDRVKNELAVIREVRKLVDIRINGKKKTDEFAIAGMR
jgi:ribosomal protein L7/L12